MTNSGEKGKSRRGILQKVIFTLNLEESRKLGVGDENRECYRIGRHPESVERVRRWRVMFEEQQTG